MNSNQAFGSKQIASSYRISRYLRGFAASLVLLTLAACGGRPSVPPPVTVTVGAAGGTVMGPSGAKVVIPAGALTKDTPIGIAQSDAGAPALPAGTTSLGATFAFTPHGTAFAVPVTITLPFDAASVPAGSAPELYKTNAQNQWERVAGATLGADSVSGAVTGFSSAQVVVPPVPPTDPPTGCDLGVTMSINITGKVLDPRGQPHVGHVVLRDRAINVGAILAEASANEAGFFLLNADGVITSAGCPRSYFIEVDSNKTGVKLYGELDATSLFPANATGQQPDLDITNTPVILEVVE